MVPCPSCVLVRREVMQQVGGFEPEFRTLYEDQVFFAKMALHTPILVSAEHWINYRQHPDSACSREGSGGFPDPARLRFLDWLERYLSQHRLRRPRVLRTLRRERWLQTHPAAGQAAVDLRRWLRRWRRRLMPWTPAALDPGRPVSSRPVVSVVIIFLDPGPFLDEAIESIRRQTFHNWELLLVDDGSQDGSSEIARQAAETEPHRVRYLEHPQHANRGMSASRNLGCVHARGAYVTFLDADDILRPEALETLLSTLRTVPRAAMAYGPVEYWYSWAGARAPRNDYVQRLGVAAPTTIEPPALLLRFLRRQAAAPSGMLVRAEVIREVRGFEDAFGGCTRTRLSAPRCAFAGRWLPRPPPSIATASIPAPAARSPIAAASRISGASPSCSGSAAIWDERATRTCECAMRFGGLWWARHPRLHGLLRRARRLRRKLAGGLRRRRPRSTAV